MVRLDRPLFLKEVLDKGDPLSPHVFIICIVLGMSCMPYQRFGKPGKSQVLVFIGVRMSKGSISDVCA